MSSKRKDLWLLRRGQAQVWSDWKGRPASCALLDVKSHVICPVWLLHQRAVKIQRDSFRVSGELIKKSGVPGRKKHYHMVKLHSEFFKGFEKSETSGMLSHMTKHFRHVNAKHFTLRRGILQTPIKEGKR